MGPYDAPGGRKVAARSDVGGPRRPSVAVDRGCWSHNARAESRLFASDWVVKRSSRSRIDARSVCGAQVYADY